MMGKVIIDNRSRLDTVGSLNVVASLISARVKCPDLYALTSLRGGYWYLVTSRKNKASETFMIQDRK